jgi:hypothetical protein
VSNPIPTPVNPENPAPAVPQPAAPAPVPPAEPLADDPATLKALVKSLREEAASRRVDNKSERERAAALEAELTKLRTEKEDREKRELAEQGKFRELAEASDKEATALKAQLAEATRKATAYEAGLKTELERLKSEVGTHANGIDLASLPLEVQVSTLRGVASAVSEVRSKAAPVVPAPAPTRTGPVPTGDESAAELTRIKNDPNMSAKGKAAALRKLGLL